MDLFWALHTHSRVHSRRRGLGVFDDVLRWVTKRAFCRALGDFFGAWGRYELYVERGIERQAEQAAMDHQRSCPVLSYDGKDAFISISRFRMLLALWGSVLPANQYDSNLYAWSRPKLLLRIEVGQARVFRL